MVMVKRNTLLKELKSKYILVQPYSALAGDRVTRGPRQRRWRLSYITRLSHVHEVGRRTYVCRALSVSYVPAWELELSGSFRTEPEHCTI